MNRTFIQNTTWLRADAPIASGLRASVRVDAVDDTQPITAGDGMVFVPAHRTEKEGIWLEQGDYELRFEDGRAARATVTRSYLQGGFLVAFFTLALAH